MVSAFTSGKPGPAEGGASAVNVQCSCATAAVLRGPVEDRKVDVRTRRKVAHGKLLGKGKVPSLSGKKHELFRNRRRKMSLWD